MGVSEIPPKPSGRTSGLFWKTRSRRGIKSNKYIVKPSFFSMVLKLIKRKNRGNRGRERRRVLNVRMRMSFTQYYSAAGWREPGLAS